MGQGHQDRRALHQCDGGDGRDQARLLRDAFARGQRCIVPVDAFHEWKKTPAGKQPYAIVGADGLPLAMAGLWERWKDRSTGDTVQMFTIITTVPNELCGAIHDRMPVALPREKWAT